MVLQSEFRDLLQYVEPSDKNCGTFSHKIHGLLVRCCAEVETNFKAILRENGYLKKQNSIEDYSKLQCTHRLAGYQVEIPDWRGATGVRKPFENWGNQTRHLRWWNGYTDIKHDRQQNFEAANFENCVDAFAAAAALLAAQFLCDDFIKTTSTGFYQDPHDGFEDAIGGYLRVCFPSDFESSEMYDFQFGKSEWEKDDPFDKIDYDSVPCVPKKPNAVSPANVIPAKVGTHD